jgi:Na+/H+ antiporter NhaD/arsenite permease-like protein
VSALLQPTGTEFLPAMITVLVFFLVFIAISFQLLHETAAALIGAITIFLISYIAGSSIPSLQILTFEDAMLFVDWNVIFLILGMMIFMAILAETNVFRWLAYRLFVISRGKAWLLVSALVILTGITSAFLNDVTAILLLVPLSIQIALVINLHPFVVVLPEIMASNIVERLALESTITHRATLNKALIVGGLTMLLFFVGDRFGHMPPSVVALAGASLLIAWVRPQMHDMLREVDWTTLLFFIGLFIVVGAMDATGAIGWAASRIAVLAGQSADLAAMLTIWISGAASAIVANIPFTVAALPVADFLSQTIPAAADTGIVYWALILGADLGGNATYLGSAPNIVAVGLLAQAGYRLSFGRFVRDGIPITVVTLLLSSIYLILRY